MYLAMRYMTRQWYTRKNEYFRWPVISASDEGIHFVDGVSVNFLESNEN